VALRRTRIVCTLGPASADLKVLRRMVAAGMDVARFNFSHGDHDFHRRLAGLVREVSNATGRHVALLQDVQGPKIRTGRLPDGQLRLQRGRQVDLVCDEDGPAAGRIPVSHAELVHALRPNDHVLLADGQIELRVRQAGGDTAHCVVVRGGTLAEHKGVAVPGRKIALPALTEKDHADLRLGAEIGFDYLALSFVRGPDDLHECRRALERLNWRVPVVAKLEQRQALRSLSQILVLADGVMVARGDLGVELPLGQVPAVQKDIIDRANRAGVPVITATEMLESMVTTTRPTRAETSDVANAIWDGTDAVMLSQETSIGAHPVETVQAMAAIAAAAEAHPSFRRERQVWREPGSISSAIAHAASAVADEVGAQAIVAFTESGRTALRVSKARPNVPIVACSPHPDVLRRCALYPGVVPISVTHAVDTDDMIAKGRAAVLSGRVVRPGARLVMVAGVSMGLSGTTNLLKVETA
jgi:pyruvate kinase